MRSVPSDSVYAKTGKGIREVEENRVKLPRDLEIVFALIDGRGSAAELLPRSDLTALRFYEALDLLVADGYIELVPERARTPEDTQPVDVALPKPESDTADRVRDLNERVQVERRSRERSEREARQALSDFGAPAYKGRQIPVGDSPIPARPPNPGEANTAAPEYRLTSLERAMSRLAEAGDPAPRHAQEPTLSALREAQSARSTHTAHEEASRRRRPQARRTKRIFTAVLMLVVLGAAIVVWLQFMPLDKYVPAAQQALAERLQQPVRIGSLRYPLLPRPRLVLEDVKLGKQQELRAQRIETPLLPWDASSRTRHVELVDAHGVEIDAAAVSMFPDWASAAFPMRIDRLRLFAAKLDIPKTNLGTFDADFAFGPEGALTQALFTNPNVRLELTAAAQGFRFLLNAHEWRVPYGPHVEFSELVADGQVEGTQSATAQLNGRAAGGAIAGTLNVRWAGAVTVNGQFKIEQARIHDLAGELTKNVSARGIVRTSGRFTLQAPEWAELPGHSQVNAQFSIARGELTNVDLLRALQSRSGTSVRGGRTPFEKLSGVVQVSEGHYSYRELHLVSGPLNATGLIDVARTGELSGRISTELGSTGGVVARSSLILTGSVEDPQVKR